jgi:predicted phage tail protein
MDNDYAGARLGRIMSHSGNKITVDAVDSSLIGGGDTMSIMGSNGKFVKYVIDGVANNVVTLNDSIMGAGWNGFAISTSVSIVYSGSSALRKRNNSVYSITASQHDPNKQAIVDEGCLTFPAIPLMATVCQTLKICASLTQILRPFRSQQPGNSYNH